MEAVLFGTIRDYTLRRCSSLFLSDFPREFQIQTVSACNAKCVFCPASRLPPELPRGRMDEDLFYRIIDEIVPHAPSKIKPYLMNEPLVDKRLPKFITYITRKRDRRTITEIYTNGGLLTESMSEELIASGLDRLIVSFQGVDRNVYESTMVGLRYDEVMKNLLSFLKIRDRAGTRKPYFEVRMVNTGFARKHISEHRKFWQDHGVKLVVKPLENELGEDMDFNVHKWRSRSFCRRLFSYGWILYNGDMVLCCCDWNRQHILGNVMLQRISEIWKSDPYIKMRNKFIAGDVADTICGKCRIDTH